MSLDDILSRKLKRIDAISNVESVFWEHKTLNIHRVVLEYRPKDRSKKYAESSAFVRSELAQRFKCSWWRGMGFGVVLYTDSPPEDIAICVDDIDGRENPKGTWQWSIFVFSSSRVAIAVHMWANGYLSEVYLQAIKRFESEGYKMASYKKEKDKLMEFLARLHPLAEFTNVSRST